MALRVADLLGVTLCDLSRAFDMVDHGVLINKLDFMMLKEMI